MVSEAPSACQLTRPPCLPDDTEHHGPSMNPNPQVLILGGGPAGAAAARARCSTTWASAIWSTGNDGWYWYSQGLFSGMGFDTLN